MAKRKNLVTLDYHYDTDTGLYQTGEIDFGISGELDNYIRQYGRKGMNDILQTMCHLIWHIQEYGYRIIKESEKNDIGERELKTN